ncbi:MAG: TRAP transporter small permease [Nitratireductor sp.]|nr:TRAP transporter small permease [Nitratireductor sp.]
MFQRIEFAGACLLLAGIVILVGIAAITRAAGQPIIWSVEIAQLLFVWLCMLAADLALQQKRHFGLMLLLDNVPATARKWIEIANMAVLIILLAFLLFYAWRNMLLMHPRLIGATQMNGSLIHASMVVGIILLLRTIISQAWHRLHDGE